MLHLLPRNALPLRCAKRRYKAGLGRGELTVPWFVWRRPVAFWSRGALLKKVMDSGVLGVGPTAVVLGALNVHGVRLLVPLVP